jgi:hypothetical protein
MSDTTYFTKDELVWVKLTEYRFFSSKVEYKQGKVLGISASGTKVLVRLLDSDETVDVYGNNVFKEKP